MLLSNRLWSYMMDVLLFLLLSYYFHTINLEEVKHDETKLQ